MYIFHWRKNIQLSMQFGITSLDTQLTSLNMQRLDSLLLVDPWTHRQGKGPKKKLLFFCTSPDPPLWRIPKTQLKKNEPLFLPKPKNLPIVYFHRLYINMSVSMTSYWNKYFISSLPPVWILTITILRSLKINIFFNFSFFIFPVLQTFLEKKKQFINK